MTYKKEVIISIVLIILLTITGCSGIMGNVNKKCSVGDACTYYSGTQGIEMMPERNPRIMYYRSEDRYEQDGNEAILSMRLENRGASDSYGALFLSGFDPGLTQMFLLQDDGNERLLEPGSTNDCYFDLVPRPGLTLNPASWASSIVGSFACTGIQGSTTGDNWRLRGNIGQAYEQLGNLFGWSNTPAIIEAVSDVNFDVSGSSGIDSFTIGFDSNYFDLFVHGKQLILLLEGIDFEQYLGAEFRLKGENPETRAGDIDVKTFIIKHTGNWPAGQDYYDIPYQWKLCYGYTTFVSPMVCVDPDPFSDEDKICRAETITWGGSQGAPIAVTRLEQTNTGKGLLLDFTIRNVGRGRVWDVGYLAGCSPYYPETVRSTMHDKVYIGPSLIGNEMLDCTPKVVRLDPNTKEGRFTCTFDLDSGINGYDIGSAYSTPVKMELWYGYEENLRDQITIRRVS
ncbi:hypothetical protein K9L97_04690 [Candidatus Woesearchaeota archaeon]|nr:hypothetical protein [Candidatus Woesearchaeota archaeon]